MIREQNHSENLTADGPIAPLLPRFPRKGMWSRVGSSVVPFSVPPWQCLSFSNKVIESFWIPPASCPIFWKFLEKARKCEFLTPEVTVFMGYLSFLILQNIAFLDSKLCVWRSRWNWAILLLFIATQHVAFDIRGKF